MPNEQINGPFTQQKFLGATISSFRVSAGWNEQSSKLDVSVYEDESTDPQDDFMLKEENVENNNGAMIGTPVRFQFQDYIFDGIIESFDEEYSFNANPGYSVTLTSPTRVLEAAQVVMSNYVGPTNDSIFHGIQQNGLSFNVSNLINAYGYMEDGGSQFGRSNINETGLLWNGPFGLKNVLEIITNSPPVSNTIPAAYKNFGCYLLYRNHFYKLDLSGLPVPPDYYRIGGGTISYNLLELISQFCQDGGVDYIVTLTLGNGNGPHTIGFKTVNRVIQPTLGQLSPYIRSHDGIDLAGASHGNELRSDITQTMLVGGNVNTLTTLETGPGFSPFILPFWGFDVNGNPIIGQKPDGSYFADDDHVMNLNASNIADIMGSIGLGLSYPCSILEMRCALVNYDSWAAFIKAYKPDLATALRLNGAVDPSIFQTIPVDRIGTTLLLDLVNDSQQFAAQLSAKFDEEYFPAVANRMWEYVRDQANIYYGKKFIVRLPFQIQLMINDSNNIILSDELADAGFLPEGSQPLGLNFINENFLLDQTGRFYPFLRFAFTNDFNAVSGPRAASLNQTGISSDVVIQYEENIYASKVFARCEQGTDFPTMQNGVISGGSPIIFVTVGGSPLPLPAIVVSIPDAIYAQGDDILGSVKDLAYMYGIDQSTLLNALYSKNTSFPIQIHPPAIYPNGVAVAMKSNQFVYGPWGRFAANGRIEFDQDESLVPWEYGGYDVLNQVALAKIQNIPMGNQVLERAQIDLAGAPEKNIGDVLVEGGPVVTSIQCVVVTEGIHTQYSMETFVNRIGAFSRENADRLKKIGKNYQKLRRSIRQLIIERNQRSQLSSINYAGYLYGASYSLQEKSPHGALVGNLFYDAVKDRWVPQISTQTHYESVSNIGANKPNVLARSACVGFEGLFRPFTFDINNLFLPLYMPPDSGINFPSNKITSTELNPYKAGSDFSWILTGVAYSGLNYKKNPDLDLSTARPLALRGPLLIEGWGYDLMGKPVPNSGAAIDLSSFGIVGLSGYAPNLYANFTQYNNEFFPGYLSKSVFWPAGAYDARWDKIRGVWASPGMIIAGVASGFGGGNQVDPGGSGYLNVYINGQPSNEFMLFTNFFTGDNANIPVNTKVLIGYDPFNNVWRPVSADCSS
jgi:hypothetical protein